MEPRQVTTRWVLAVVLGGLLCGVLGPTGNTVAWAQPAHHPGVHAPVHARDRVYVVRPGDSIRRIAATLQVPVRDVAALNGLRAPFTLSVGRRLRVPTDVPQEVLVTLPSRDEVTSNGEGGAHRAGMVTLVRARDGAETTTNFNVGGASLRNRVARWMQARDGSIHLVHPRLVRVFPTISDRFGGRRITVLSGYRPHRGGRDEPRSRHAMGYAVDLRVEGVPVRALWDFCKTIPSVGCGLATHGNYVHVDVRPASEAWTVGARNEPTPPECDPHEATEDSRPVE